MLDDAPKLDKLLSHRKLGRSLTREGIGREFELIRQAFQAASKRVPADKDFAAVGRGSGTHLLKLVSSRAPTDQNVLRLLAPGANRHSSLVPSLDAKMAPVAKIVFRPLEVEGHPPRPLAEHILDPDELSPVVTQAFANVFGADALAALREALTTSLPAVTRLPAAEFPIIFLPRPGGGDLQATPLAPAEAYERMREVAQPYFQKREDGRPSPLRGHWHRQHVSGKAQNISSAIGPERIRFLARMPRVLDRLGAELFRYAQGGTFPRWRDDAVPGAVARYADLLDLSTGFPDQSRKYSNPNIREGRDRRADALITAARAFIDEMVGEVHAEHPNARMRDPPSVTDVVMRCHWLKRDDRDRARRVLNSPHFKERLQKAGEA